MLCTFCDFSSFFSFPVCRFFIVPVFQLLFCPSVYLFYYYSMFYCPMAVCRSFLLRSQCVPPSCSQCASLCTRISPSQCVLDSFSLIFLLLFLMSGPGTQTSRMMLYIKLLEDFSSSNLLSLLEISAYCSVMRCSALSFGSDPDPEKKLM